MNERKAPISLVKPKYHVAWVAFLAMFLILSFLTSVFLFKNDIHFIVFFLIFYFTFTFFNLFFLSKSKYSFAPYFYIRKHHIDKAIKPHTVYQRLDYISISFHKNKLHAETIPAVFEGFILNGSKLFDITIESKDPLLNSAKFKSYNEETEQYWVWGEYVPKNKFLKHSNSQLKMAKLMKDF